MSLKDTEKKIYDPNSNIEKREHSKSIFDLDNNNRSKTNNNKFHSHKKRWGIWLFFEFDASTKKTIYLGLAILFGIFIFSSLIVGVYKFKKTSFMEDKVSVAISGNTSVDSAENVKFVINYENNNRVDLKNVEIILTYPDGFYPRESSNLKKVSDRSSRISIGTLKAHNNGVAEVEGKFYTAENYTVYLQAEMRYVPGNFNSVFATKAQISLNVSSSPLKLKIETPKDALDNSTIEYKIFYKNEGDAFLKDLNLKLEYPNGFIYQGADPNPINDRENIWHLGDIPAGGEGYITVRGVVSGNRYDVKLFKGIIFSNENDGRKVVYSNAESVMKIVVPPLSISHKIDGKSFLNANFGDVLRYEINYINNGDTNLRNVIIKLKIDSPVIDYQKIRLSSGALDTKNKIIEWKASDIEKLKNLEPGDSGKIKFEIPLKDGIEINNSADKNFVIKSFATIDSSDIVYADLGFSKNISNEVVVKVNSKVSLTTQIFYNDELIKNNGPIPPKIGKETTYSVVWKVKNLSNNISDVKVIAYLPTWVKWKNIVSPKSEDVKFDERTNMVSWNIGDLPAGVGYLSKDRECHFQIGITPEVNQKDKSINLILESVLNATDGFTGDSIIIKNPAKTTVITNDKGVSDNGYLVEE